MTFWQGKRVFVTGHTGFKGSWLSLWLQKLGADLVGFALPPPTLPNLFTLANVAKNMTSISGDIRDFALLQKTLVEHRPEIVIHMAAQALVRPSYQNPVETYATNAMGTVYLLEAIRQTGGVKVLINVTTDKCYANKEQNIAYGEEDRLGGYDPYSNSKACSELITAAYRDSYFNAKNQQQPAVAVASARAGNVLGGGDWAIDRLMPDLMQACLNGRPLCIRNPYALRPWQHVLEPLSGYLLLAQKMYDFPLEYAESWNFGPNEDEIKPVNWVVDYVLKLWKSTVEWTLDQSQQPHEALYLRLDCAKAKARLNWRPRWNLETGLEKTVLWYKALQHQKNMSAVTRGQIDAFMQGSA
jgi:CDP-glucose 4,6-dehydratase